MKTINTSVVVLCAIFLAANMAHAAFVVEVHASGKGNANFSFGGDTTEASTSTPSAAVALSGTNSIFGGNGVNLPDTYVFSYTPGTDVDNTMFAVGEVLGSTTGYPGQGNVATGFLGGSEGLYNVYFTTPASTGVSGGGSDFTLTQNGPNIILDDIDQNNGGTGPDTDPGPAFVGGANNAWFKLGTVFLSPGNTYTVTMAANANTFVSQRAHGVMWELAIPEPATVAYLAPLALIGLVAWRRRVRRTA